MENRLEVILVSKKRNLLRTLRLPIILFYILAGFFITATVSTIVLFVNSTRRTFVKMHLTKVERENKNLVAKLESINVSLRRTQKSFDQHITQDNRERTYWQMAHIHPDIWSMGIGGKQTEDRPHIANRNTQRIIDEIYESVDVLKGKYYLRQTSLRDIHEQIEDNLYLWSHTPSVHPLPGCRICSGYGYRVDPIDRDVRMHWGLDIGAPRGTRILATADGFVSYAGWLGGYGWTVIVDHGFGFKTAYAHCQKILVRYNEPVKRGQVIARVGSTGRSISPHLHYEVRVSGMKINPYKYISNSEVIFD
ncbi:MAG: M23 family metallopeptidase [candidate division WOR-3 bacterium]|nr:MAG: M23 family metallopeptidase [candidate division WOR-3 bacterium]